MSQSNSLSVPPARLTPLELELAALIVRALNLVDVRPESIDPDAPLLGEGLGLDSIDALEIGLALASRYGVQLQSDDEQAAQAPFASLRTLAQLVDQIRTK